MAPTIPQFTPTPPVRAETWDGRSPAPPDYWSPQQMTRRMGEQMQLASAYQGANLAPQFLDGWQTILAHLKGKIPDNVYQMFARTPSRQEFEDSVLNAPIDDGFWASLRGTGGMTLNPNGGGKGGAGTGGNGYGAGTGAGAGGSGAGTGAHGGMPTIDPKYGTMLSGPNPIITAPFRHLFTQEQVNNYGQRVPMQVPTMGPDGKINDQAVNWWEPLQQSIGKLTS